MARSLGVSLMTGIFLGDRVEIRHAMNETVAPASTLRHMAQSSPAAFHWKDSEPLGRERPHQDLQTERKGVRAILMALNDEEKAQLSDDCMPIRHLRAEKGNVEHAIQKLRSALEWRKSFDVARLVNAEASNDSEMIATLAEENATGKVYVRGYDKDGRANVYMRPGRENTHEMMNQMRHLVWNLEKAFACTARASAKPGQPPLEKINLLVDFDGYKLSNAPPMATTKYTLDILQTYYPERMYRTYILHPPLIFRTFWSLVKVFVDPVTKEKMVFVVGKAGTAKLMEQMGSNMDRVEDCAGGTATKPFKSADYVPLPLDVSFGEEPPATKSKEAPVKKKLEGTGEHEVESLVSKEQAPPKAKKTPRNVKQKSSRKKRDFV